MTLEDVVRQIETFTPHGGDEKLTFKQGLHAAAVILESDKDYKLRQHIEEKIQMLRQEEKGWVQTINVSEGTAGVDEANHLAETIHLLEDILEGK